MRRLFFVVCLISSVLYSQEDSSRLDYIYLRQYRPGDSLAIQPWEGDFMRNRQLVRIDVFHPLNAPLKQARNSDPFQEYCPGIHGLLLRLALNGDIPLLDPASPSRKMTYSELAARLISWQGISPGPNQEISGSELGLEWLQPTLDLIVDRSFSAQDSRSHYRIRYLRLIWHHPHLALGPRAVALIPYRIVRPYLLESTCEPGPRNPGNISLAEFLEQGYVYGAVFRLPEDPVLVIPASTHHVPSYRVDWEH